VDCDGVVLLVAVGVHSRTLSGSEEEQLHAHIASCEACRALTHDTEHDRPRRIGGAVSVRQIVARERETRRALAEAQLERGRQLVVDGGAAQGAAYLAAALTELPDDPVALRLATIALRDVDRRLGSFAGTAAAFRRDGSELAIGQADGTIQQIDPTGEAPRPAGRAVGDPTPRDRASPIDPVTRGDPGSPPRGTLPPVGGPIAALAYSDDGARLAVAARTGAYLDDDHVIVSGKTGRLEILEVSGRRLGPPLTASDVIQRVGESPRWRVVNGRVVERP
jgi:hypothetical protein